MKKWKRLSLSVLVATLPISLAAHAQDSQKKSAGADEYTPERMERLRNEYAPWNPKDIEKLRKQVGLIGPGPQEDYPKAKFPKIVKPKSVEELMPKARKAILQKGGLAPIGVSLPGEKILLIVPVADRGGADPMVQEAIKRAFAERKIDAHIIYDYELLGIPKEELVAMQKAKSSVWKAGEGEKEALFMMDLWPAGQAWLKEKFPALYQKVYRDVKYPNPKLADLAKNYRMHVDAAAIKYLDAHPEYDKFFSGQGNPTGVRVRMKHHGKRYSGNYAYLSYFDLLSSSGEFPSDVWKMMENKMMEPIKYVDRLETSDPEGTALYADVSEKVSQAWAAGVYQQGHLYMFPLQATGRFPYSTVEYPALRGSYLPPMLVNANGVVAATNSHANTQPRMEVWFKDGYISQVKGGGIFGEVYRKLLTYPKINETTWPFAEKPGWWWLYEAGTATNPKFNKSPVEVLQGSNNTERLAGGTVHWSIGFELVHGPEVSGKTSPRTDAFFKETDLPIGHGQHMHTLLPTYQARIRDGGKWLTLIEHGTLTSMRDPEVRALASRYGNADEILSRDYYPPLPGINVKGDYEKDYLKDTGAYWEKWATEIINGTSPYIQ